MSLPSFELQIALRLIVGWCLATSLISTSSLDLRALNLAEETTTRMPASAARLLVQILDE